MRWTLISFLCIVTLNNAMGQRHLIENQAESENSINIASEEVFKSFTPAPESLNQLKSATVSSTEINVEYVDFPEEAKQAFEYATSIWKSLITSTVPINIKAKWEHFDENYLATSRPALHYKNFNGAQIQDVYYPIPLVEKLSGEEWNGSNEEDIICKFNKDASWYFGTDGNTPETKYDFVTVALHEITHGLGFSGYIKDNNDTGFFGNDQSLPSIYDYLISNSSNQRISDPSVFNSPSKELHNQLVSENLWHFARTGQNEGRQLASSIYAPKTWNEGASIYHLDELVYKSGSEDALMTAFLKKGEAIHNPGNITLDILANLGWESVSFSFDEIKDFEETCEKLPVSLDIFSDLPIDSASIKMFFSTDYFKTCDSVGLNFNTSNNQFSGDLPINFYKGGMQYYFKATSKDCRVFKYPSEAPARKLCFSIGPDYYAPQIVHNPVKLISTVEQNIQINTFVEDNVGVNSVKVEYIIDGIEQEPIQLNNYQKNQYLGEFQIPGFLSGNSSIQYRIVATDVSEKNNKKSVPENGYFNVKIFDALVPVGNYQNDFNSFSDDFVTIDFDITNPAGFSTGILHTKNPYPTSSFDNENYNLIAQLKYPVIIEDNGEMSFDEIVLVEPGEANANYTDQIFWDFVIVEGSKDFGKTWQPFIDGYDSGVDDLWLTEFNKSIVNNSSKVTGHESMFAQRIINLTENNLFSAGDTVIFRFRLASDKMINGWGWAIENLQIQTLSSDFEELLSEEYVNVYPNPCSNNIYVDCSNVSDISSVDISITDLFGKTVLQEPWLDVRSNPKKNIEFSNLRTGIYLVNVTIEDSYTVTKKIIKQ